MPTMRALPVLDCGSPILMTVILRCEQPFRWLPCDRSQTEASVVARVVRPASLLIEFGLARQ
jgi:hypothetical protein